MVYTKSTCRYELILIKTSFTFFKAYANMFGGRLEGGKTGAQIAKEFFEEMDADGDQTVTFKEFREAARRNSAILSIVNPEPPNWNN